eukprot:TRINITY_DN2120_c0_g2_i1.p1 TRINITY_DN2120_c0_g2~~TRINITY_DN2120_c0_g2_i1.p1  ORF type:complete len:263 (+),score=72.46 TRINITY_DN2120_c0_g2_i1:533-1321(+)
MVNGIGPYLLSSLLLNLMKKSEQSRIVNVTCNLAEFGKLQLGDLEGKKKEYHGGLCFSSTKLLSILLHLLLRRNLAVECFSPSFSKPFQLFSSPSTKSFKKSTTDTATDTATDTTTDTTTDAINETNVNTINTHSKPKSNPSVVSIFPGIFDTKLFRQTLSVQTSLFGVKNDLLVRFFDSLVIEAYAKLKGLVVSPLEKGAEEVLKVALSPVISEDGAGPIYYPNGDDTSSLFFERFEVDDGLLDLLAEEVGEMISSRFCSN